MDHPSFMNARTASLSLLLLALTATTKAQESTCPHCAVKDQAIADLKAELRALKEGPSTTPETTEVVTPAAEPAPAIDSGATYTVEPGDSLIKIARKTGCKAADIASLNGLTLESTIRAGQKLKMPSGAATAAATPSAEPTSAPEPAPAEARTYKIQDGDTYYSIAKRLNVPLDVLMAANPKIKPTQLYTGRTIQLPTGAGMAVSSEPDTAPVAEPTPAPEPEQKIRAIMVDEEITYGEFATKHGTDIERLNSLNDLNLTSSTILAKGSELYVPAQP